MASGYNAHLNWLKWLHFLTLVEDSFIRYTARLHDILSSLLDVVRMWMSITTWNFHDHNNFFPRTAIQWNVP